MDIRELKSLLKNSTSVLILDEGEPAFVLVDYSVYKRMTGEGPTQSFPSTVPHEKPERELTPHESELLERLNKEIFALKEQLAADNEEVAIDTPSRLEEGY